MKIKGRAVVRGAAAALDMGATARHVKSSRIRRYTSRSDQAAMAEDWQTVGEDLRRAMRTHGAAITR